MILGFFQGLFVLFAVGTLNFKFILMVYGAYALWDIGSTLGKVISERIEISKLENILAEKQKQNTSK
jgi:hypothetical protein